MKRSGDVPNDFYPLHNKIILYDYNRELYFPNIQKILNGP